MRISRHNPPLIPLATILAALALAGCPIPMPRAAYGPMDEWKRGYDEVQLDRNTYRVIYKGRGLERETAERYLFYRCAELTLEHGYDYFVVVDQMTNEEIKSTTTNTSKSETTKDGDDDKKSTTVVTNESKVDTYTTYTPVKTIKVFKGRKPDDNFKAFNAREMVATLAGKIERRDTTDMAGARR